MIDDLCERLMVALKPIAMGHRTGDVVAALSIVFWGLLKAIELPPLESALVVRSYVDALDPSIKAALKAHRQAKYPDGPVLDVDDRLLYTRLGLE